jgi:hypothetical protein
MRIDYLNQCHSKDENVLFEPFINYYITNYYPDTDCIRVACPDLNSQYKNADYYLPDLKILIEIKRIVDRDLVEFQAKWAANIRHLEDIIKNMDLSDIHGAYLVNTPNAINNVKGKEHNIINRIIEMIRLGQSNFEMPNIGTFEIIKFNDTNNFIGFMLMGPGKEINTPLTIHRNISNKLFTANEQLSQHKGLEINKRIVLLANKIIFATETYQFINGLNYSYDNLNKLNNIDEIWVQVETHDGTFLHTILFYKGFNSSIENESINNNDLFLFENWFPALYESESVSRNKLLACLRKLLINKSAYEIFKLVPTRIIIAKMAEWLIDNESFEDAIWIIERFINDPDPPEPEDYGFHNSINYHELILKGEDPSIITTVLGHIAWTIQKLTGKPDYMDKAYEYTAKLLNHKNLYVKLMALYPFIGICANRSYMKVNKKELYEKVNPWVNKTAFALLNDIKKNRNLKAIARALCRVFSYYKDISTDEAIYVLETLRITADSASLFVYFGVFRARHFINSGIPFDGIKLKNYFLNIIKNDDARLYDLRASITWHIWKILEDNKNEFEILKEYIDILSINKYWSNIVHNIEFIINDWINKKPDECIFWYKNILNGISDYSQTDKAKEYVLSVWTFHTEEIVNKIAEERPIELEPTVFQLISLHKRGVFIGDIPTILESYRLVKNKNIQFDIAIKFRELYNSLLKDGLKLRQIDWSDILSN